MVNEKLVSMLFADLKGFSAIKNDELKAKIVKFIEVEILNQLLNSTNHIYRNTWGDAFYVCSENPVLLAEFALQARDKIRHKDWIRFGLSEDLELRIALHAQIAQVMIEPNGTISNVVGKGVDTTARIEPVTKPNDVCCSETFHQLLINENTQNIKSIALGHTKLAKNFGEMNLFRLVWASEAPPHVSTVPITSTPSIPQIKRKHSDREKADFLDNAFDRIRIYLQMALNQLSGANSNISFKFEDITSKKFICEIYLHGEHKNSCKIWMGGRNFGGEGIAYSEGRFNTDSDNSYNEMLSVEDDGFELFLKPLMGDIFFNTSKGNKLSIDQISEYLWKRFTRILTQ